MERENLYINKYKYNKEMLVEYINTITKKTRIICLIFGIIAGIAAFFEYKNNFVFFIFLVIISLMMFVLAAFYNSYKVKKTIKDKNIFKEITVNFGTIDIIVNSKNDNTKIKYAQIFEILESKNAIYLMITKDEGIVVKKDGFENDDYIEFKNFLDDKFVKAPSRTGGG